MACEHKKIAIDRKSARGAWCEQEVGPPLIQTVRDAMCVECGARILVGREEPGKPVWIDDDTKDGCESTATLVKQIQ
ncbi:hypothetical protein LCGC14_2379000 [marine sediment metagenome]|uniref:Uncharacterized protein n=1 Tax=marine sediment metagenome TaxID=412755 RepID=A0A0F9EW75_9ZZZZ